MNFTIDMHVYMLTRYRANLIWADVPYLLHSIDISSDFESYSILLLTSVRDQGPQLQEEEEEEID